MEDAAEDREDLEAFRDPPPLGRDVDLGLVRLLVLDTFDEVLDFERER